MLTVPWTETAALSVTLALFLPHCARGRAIAIGEFRCQYPVLLVRRWARGRRCGRPWTLHETRVLEKVQSRLAVTHGSRVRWCTPTNQTYTMV